MRAKNRGMIGLQYAVDLAADPLGNHRQERQHSGGIDRWRDAFCRA
jgi:hypothetical protein